ncbi:MAG: DMT family transporter [Alphaproteobacteria bacterium]
MTDPAAERRALWGAGISVVSSAAAGASLVAVRVAVAEVPPLTLTLMRIAIALALIAPLALATGGRWPRGRDLVAVMALGILLFALGQWLVSLSLAFTTAARGAIIFSTVPVMTLVAAAALGIERLTPAKGAGVLLATAGVLLAMGGSAGGLPGVWRGDLIMLAAAAAIAAYNIGARATSRRYRPLVFISANMAPAVLCWRWRRRRAACRCWRSTCRGRCGWPWPSSAWSAAPSPTGCSCWPSA